MLVILTEYFRDFLRSKANSRIKSKDGSLTTSDSWRHSANVILFHLPTFFAKAYSLSYRAIQSFGTQAVIHKAKVLPPPCKKTYSRTPLIRTLVIRIALALRVKLSTVLQNVLALKLPVIGSSTEQCHGF